LPTGCLAKACVVPPWAIPDRGDTMSRIVLAVILTLAVLVIFGVIDIAVR
jgi:hypothetical protein